MQLFITIPSRRKLQEVIQCCMQEGLPCYFYFIIIIVTRVVPRKGLSREFVRCVLRGVVRGVAHDAVRGAVRGVACCVECESNNNNK